MRSAATIVEFDHATNRRTLLGLKGADAADDLVFGALQQPSEERTLTAILKLVQAAQCRQDGIMGGVLTVGHEHAILRADQLAQSGP
jgi:hypothetical protein